MSNISLRRLAAAVLAGGVVLNLVDVPWSALVMAPRLQAFLDDHRLTFSPLTGPWFLAVHFAYVALIAWTYAHASRRLPGGWRLALAVGAAFLLVNRAFGLGNVLIGLMPLSVFLGFSASFALGALAASLVAGTIVDAAAPRAGATA